MFFVVSAMDKARDSLHMARLPLPSSDMSDQAAAQINYTENYAREMQKCPTAWFWNVPTKAWITPDEMYALAVIASLMLLRKIASEHESTEYDFLLGDDDMMGSMDRSKNRDTNQKQYHPHPHSPEPLSSMLRRSTRDLLHVTSMRVYNISTLKSGARGRWG